MGDEQKSAGPQIKRRKIAHHIPSTTNSSMKQERESSDDDNDNDNHKIIFPKDADSKWKEYQMDIIKLRYHVDSETHLHSLGDLWRGLNFKVKIEFEYVYKENKH